MFKFGILPFSENRGFIYQLEALRQKSGQIYPKTNYKWQKTQSALLKIPIFDGLDIDEGNV